uniref:Reticulon-like protein n=1 Tax=Noccaea caerulescens TaxID=107243 RepID=A0A1J3CQF1_NOCCA
MDPSNSRRRRISVGGAVVAAGSVWETKMQTDDEVSNNNAIVKAIHLHAADEHDNSNKQMSLKETALGVNGKRRAWKSDVKSSSTEISRADSSLKLTRPRSFGTTPPVTPRRSIGTTPPMTPRRSISGDSSDKSLTVSVSAKKTRSDSVEGIEKTPGRVKKTRSELCTAIVKSGEFDSAALRKVNSLPARSSEKSDEKTEHVDVLPEEKKEETVTEKLQIPEEVKEFGVCQETVVSANTNEDEQINNGDHEEEEREAEKKSVDVKEMNVAKEDSNNRVGVEIKKYSQFHNRTAPSPSTVRKIPPPVTKRATSVYSVPPRKDRFAEEEHHFTQPQSKLQSLVDLVMWREASRSALVFGFGTFLIISSSYANDLNFSFISVVAYMGLIYLGVMFVFKSVIHRGMVEEEERHKEGGVREEDVRRMLRLIMPYLNESLLQLKTFFSGDPSTTLKMGVVLFVLARCGSSITLWNLAKFGFLGAFTVPKIFISYSTHFSAYGKFWVRRFRDAWESCNHKKAVALALFTLVWNLSSVVARVWAAFMLFVALKYYQQKMIWTTDQDGDDDDEEEEEEEEEEEHVVDDDKEEEEQVPTLKRAAYMMMMPNKLKKNS